MAAGGGLVSSYPTQGVPTAEIEEATTSNNEEISALPNEAADIIVVDEDGNHISLDDLPPTLTTASTFHQQAGSSQDTLAPTSSNTALEKEKGSSSYKETVNTNEDIEKQVQNIEHRLDDSQEVRLDFSNVDLITRQAFLLKCTKALLAFGAPSHRIEADLDFAADILSVPAQFIHNPNCVVVNFGVAGSHLGDTITVKHTTGGLDLGNLHQVNNVWRSVESGAVTVKEAALQVTDMLEKKPIYPTWQRVIVAALMSGVICPMGFSGSFADAMLATLFAAILTWLKFSSAVQNQRFGDIFEIVVATCISFAAKGLSHIGHIFCYEATLSAGLVGILPGFFILAGALELAGKNFVGGAVRLVYAIIYSLFLGFGIGVGSDLYGAFDKSARGGADNPDMVSLYGTVTNGTTPFMTGTFTFNNGTDNASWSAIDHGNIKCNRSPTDGWYAKPLNNQWYLFLLVPTFAILLAISNLQPVKRKEMVAMVLIGCAGWSANNFAGAYIHNRSDIVSCIGGLTVGILANIYGRITRSSSFVVGISGILYLVPSGVAAAGGLVISGRGHEADGAVYQHSLGVGLLMVEIAIGITVGLFFSSFLAHIFNSKRSKLNDHLRAFSF